MNEIEKLSLGEMVSYITHPVREVRDAAIMAYLNMVRSAEIFDPQQIEEEIEKLSDGKKRVEEFYRSLLNSIGHSEDNDKVFDVLLMSIGKVMETDEVDDAFMALLGLCIDAPVKKIRDRANSCFVKLYMDYCYLGKIKNHARIADEYLIKPVYTNFQICLKRLFELPSIKKISDVVQNVNDIMPICDPTLSEEQIEGSLLVLAEAIKGKYNGNDGLAFPKKLFGWADQFPGKKEAFEEMAIGLLETYRYNITWNAEAVALVSRFKSEKQIHFLNNVVYELRDRLSDKEQEAITAFIGQYMIKELGFSADAMELVSKFPARYVIETLDRALKVWAKNDLEIMQQYLVWYKKVNYTSDIANLEEHIVRMHKLKQELKESSKDCSKTIDAVIKNRLSYVCEKKDSPRLLIRLLEHFDVTEYCVDKNIKYPHETLQQLYASFDPYECREKREKQHKLYRFIIDACPTLKFGSYKIPPAESEEVFAEKKSEASKILEKLNLYL